MAKPIEDDRKRLFKLNDLLEEYRVYIRTRESQPLAAEIVEKVRQWVHANALDIGQGE